MNIILRNEKMITVTATALKEHFGEYAEDAQREPVIIQRHSRNSLALVAYEYWARMQQRIAYLEDYKLSQEMADIRKNGKFVSGAEAISRLEALAK